MPKEIVHYTIGRCHALGAIVEKPLCANPTSRNYRMTRDIRNPKVMRKITCPDCLKEIIHIQSKAISLTLKPSPWVHLAKGDTALCGKYLAGGGHWVERTGQPHKVTCRPCLKELLREATACSKSIADGIRSVRSLMDESDGVAGLHLNGELATWGELEDTWLDEFVTAERSI